MVESIANVLNEEVVIYAIEYYLEVTCLKISVFVLFTLID